MKISYYPGCTLKNNASNFESSTLCSMEKLGIEVQEISRWNCCGTVFSLATDDLMHHIAPIRNLLRVKESGHDTVMTPCAMCYNTLKRANEKIKSDPESMEKINTFMYKETVEYNGEVEVLHPLEILRDQITFAGIKEKVTKPLANLKVASYYGCYLVRPKEIGLDDVENPTILEDLLDSLGAEPVDFPHKTECCGAYQTVDKPEVVADRTNQILTSAQKLGAEVVVVSCPLCAFNLDQRQKDTVKKYPEFKHIPVLYFTQLMALALGCKKESLGLEINYINPKPILKKKGLI